MGTQRSVHFGSHGPLTLGDCCSENDFKMTAPGRFVISSVPGAAMVTLISECGWTPSGVCIQVWSGDPRLMEHIQYLDGARQFNLNSSSSAWRHSRSDVAALPGRPKEDGIAMLQAGTATAAYPATRFVMMAIACFQGLMTS